MALSLIDLVRSEFRTSRAGDELNSRFQSLLGLPHRYGPARLALGRSLGVAAQPPELELNTLGYGKPIRGENFFGQGAELATWITLIVQHSGETDLDRKTFQNLVGAHWHRGLYLLWDDWRNAGSDFDRFVTRLVRTAEGRGHRAVAKV